MEEKDYKTSRGFRVRLEARLKNGALIEARHKLGKSARQVSTEMGVSYSRYLEYESMRGYPSKRMQDKICEYFRDQGVFLIEDETFPVELRSVDPNKTRHYASTTIPAQALISLSRVSQRLLPAVSSVEEIFENQDRNSALEQAISSTRRITQRGKLILRALYGIGMPQRDPRELAAELGLNHTALMAAKNLALKRLREASPLILDPLKEYL